MLDAQLRAVGIRAPFGDASGYDFVALFAERRTRALLMPQGKAGGRAARVTLSSAPTYSDAAVLRP
jgi:hypothetical protein